MGISSLLIGGIVFWWVHTDFRAAHLSGYTGLTELLISCICFLLVGPNLAIIIKTILIPTFARHLGPGARSCNGQITLVIIYLSLLFIFTPGLEHWPHVAMMIITLCGIACCRCMTTTFPIARPAAVELVPKPSRPLCCGPQDNQKWDVFLSYHSNDANSVRRFAESLLRQGYRPWFAEYEIQPHEWYDLDVIAQKLAEGVAGSAYFLVFTNDQWAASSWCNEEMRAILHKLSPSDGGEQQKTWERVAEVRLPPSASPHVVFPPLAAARHCTVDHDVLAIWDFIEKDLGWFIRLQDESMLLKKERVQSTQGRIYLPGGYSLSADLVAKWPTQLVPINDKARFTDWHIRRFDGRWMGRSVGVRVLSNAYKNRFGVLNSAAGVSDDRAIYRRHITEHIKSIGKFGGDAEMIGIHLFRMNNGHTGFSYSVVSREAKTPVLRRVYELPLREVVKCRSCGCEVEFAESEATSFPEDDIAVCMNPHCQHAELWPSSIRAVQGELEISFVMKADQDDAQSCRRQLAAIAPLMDALVNSLRREWWHGLHAWQAVLWRSSAVLMVWRGWLLIEAAPIPSWQSAMWLGLLGFVAMELLLTVGIPGYRVAVMRAYFGRKPFMYICPLIDSAWNVIRGGIRESIRSLVMTRFPLGLGMAIVVPLLPSNHIGLALSLGAAVSVTSLYADLLLNVSAYQRASGSDIDE